MLRNQFSIIMLVGLVIVFISLSAQFATFSNARVILEQSAVLVVVAIGATFVIIAGSIDLSVGSIAGLGAVSTAILMADMGPAIAVPLALLIGLFLGLVNGVIFSLGKIPSFIVTLGMLTAVRGVILGVSGGSPTMIKNEGFLDLVAGRHIGVSNVVFIAVVIVAIAYVVLEKLAFGRELRAIGGGEKVARLTGINVDRTKILAFVICGMLAVIGGIMMAARSRVGDPTQGSGFELQAIAAVVIGGTPLTGGVGRILGTVIGAITIGVLSNGLNIIGVRPFWQEIITGVVLVLAVVLTIDRKKIGIIK
ncbi:MAG: ABC transporter permease [Leucobacter sp.]